MAALPYRFTDHYPGFDLNTAYAVANRLCALRQTAGEVPVGRKIGATNRLMWPVLGATGPFWSFIYDTTVFELSRLRDGFDLGQFPEPRLEPEIVLHLATTPEAGMTEAALLGCIDRVAHGFELVHSPFVGWKFSAPDATAAYGLHMALLLGPWHDISADRAPWASILKTLKVSLSGSDGSQRSGAGRDALGSPLLALQFLVDDLFAHPDQPPLRAGDIVTTGTLTVAMAVKPDQVWTTTVTGAPLAGLRVAFH